MNIQEIAKFIIKKYPDSCLASNIDDNYFEDYYEKELAKECIDFFKYDILGLCGCGRPEDTLNVIKDILNAQEKFFTTNTSIGSYEGKEKTLNNLCGIEIKDNSNCDGLIQFVLYVLNDKDLLEHGGGVGGSWLTDLGKMFLFLLNNYDLDLD